jgi:hypothetical protein
MSEKQAVLPALIPTKDELAQGKALREAYKDIRGGEVNQFHVADLLCRERQLLTLLQSLEDAGIEVKDGKVVLK